MASDFRNTALHAAADTGNLTLAAKLIERGADLTVVGKGGWRPLLMAVYKGHAPVVRILLEAGADVHDERMPLHVAAEYGYETIIRSLIEFGADVNRLDQRGRTPLDLAGTDGAADLLRAHGAQPADPGRRNL